MGTKPNTVSIFAAMFSGNQGAASMLHATIQQLKTIEPEVHINVFTVYPEADKALNRYENVTVFSATPTRLVTRLIPEAFVHRVFPFLRRFLRGPGVHELEKSTVLIDLAGISFADGREAFLVYNLATLLPAMFLRVPIVKFAQASGPFKSKVNRLVAGNVLHKMNKIFARGAETRKALDSLSLPNVADASDVAFLFKPDKESEQIAHDFMNSHGLVSEEFLVVAPSSVLLKKAQKKNIDYIQKTADYIGWLEQTYNLPVLLLPHSVRLNSDKTHNNDLLVCRQVHEALPDGASCVLPEEPLYAGALKVLIGKAQLVVTARFHAMISSLSTETPVVVTGWSHKYQEVLDSFGVDVPAVYLDDAFSKNLKSRTEHAINTREETVATLKQVRPTIESQSRKQIDYVAKNIL